MRKSKWIKILTSTGILFLIVFVIIPPFTRRWYQNHALKFAPPASTDSWKKFSSNEGKFSAWFPGTPEETIEPLHGLISQIEAHCFAAKADIQDFYGIVYGDIPTNVDLKNPSSLFDRAQAMEAEQNGSGKIVFQQEIKLKDYPGREFEFAAGGKANYSGRVKVFLVGQRIYVLTVVFLTANPHKVDQETFFNSFSLQKN